MLTVVVPPLLQRTLPYYLPRAKGKPTMIAEQRLARQCKLCLLSHFPPARLIYFFPSNQSLPSSHNFMRWCNNTLTIKTMPIYYAGVL